MLSGAINAAGDAIKGLANNAGDIADGVGDIAHGAGDAARGMGDAASSFLDGDLFDFDTIKDAGSSIVDGAKGVLSGQESLGGAVGGALDSIGLPDWAGNLAGGALDALTGNYAGAIEQGTSILGDVASAADIDGLEGFLDTAGDISGMFNGMTGPGAGIGGGSGALADVAGTPTVGELGVPSAGGMGEYAQGAADLVTCGSAGDLQGAGTGVFDMLGDTLGGLGGLLGDTGSQVVDGVQEALGGAGQLVGDLFDQFTGSEIANTPPQEIADQVGTDVDNPVATAATDVARELPSCINSDQPLGTAIFESPAGEQLAGALSELAAEHGGEWSAEISVEAVISDAIDTTRGMADVADLNMEVADEIQSTLEQVSSMSTSVSVSEMRGAQVRC